VRGYRITRTESRSGRLIGILDGTGASIFGARWNSPGRSVIYAAEHFSLAMLEVVVHANAPMPPMQYAEISIPEDVQIEEARIEDLPPGWDSIPYQRASQEYGDKWYDKGGTAVLLVPSVVAKIERNVLINPRHPDFSRLIRAADPRPVIWDPRLFPVFNKE